MRILDLLARDELALSVVWAEPALLERTIAGSYILDLPRPSKFLNEGDIVLSAALWHTGEESARVFVESIAALGVAALVIGRIVLGEIPDYIVRECREREIVLLTISPDVSFKSITQVVDSENVSDRAESASHSIEVNRRLLDRLGSGSGVQGALRMLFDEFAIESWVFESHGRVTAVAGVAPSDEFVAQVWNQALGAGDTEFVVSGGDRRSSTVWPIVTDDATPIGYLVCAGDHRTWPVDIARVVATLVVVARVELEIEAKRRESGLRQASEFVDLLASETLSPGEASARLRLLGADPLEPVVVVAGTVVEPGYPTRALLESLVTTLESTGSTIVGCEFGAEAIVFISGPDVTPEQVVEAGSHVDSGVIDLFGARHLRVGVSEPTVSISHLGQAVASARARMRAAIGDETITWATRSTPVSYDALLDMLPERVRYSFGNGLLAPLVEYDARHGSELIATLQVFLDNGSAWQQAATELHVHVNTLRYRIGRIEALTHRDLGTMHDRVDLFLALASVQRGTER